MYTFSFFFFSSRRRHTRCSRDWSSDVCSSDLLPITASARRWRIFPNCECGFTASSTAIWKCSKISWKPLWTARNFVDSPSPRCFPTRSEEHTSELQSRLHLVCRLLLEKKTTHYT